MMGRTSIMMNWTTSLMMLIFITATLAQGVADDFDDFYTDKFGPLEVTKGEFESNRLYRKESELEQSQASADAAVTTGVKLQDQGALAAVLGTRRRGTHNATSSKVPNTRRGCVTEGAVFAEGSAMVSPDECSYCFCIRGRQRCVAPKCLLPVEGCRPRYRTFSCCPAYYDCHDASTTTTTTTRTPRDCEVKGVRYAEGTLVEGEGGECENCYCLNGEVTCSRTTCAPPLDGCKPVMQEGHCCPVKYDCDNGNRRVSVDQFFKDFPVKITTIDQRREFERMKPEWQTNMARQFPGGSVTIADPDESQSLLESLTEAPIESPEAQAPFEEGAGNKAPVEQSQYGEGETPPTEPEEENEEPGKPPSISHPRKRLSSLITRPSREELANRRKQSRFTTTNDRQPTFQRPRIQTLSSHLRQRYKQNKDQNGDDRTEELEASSSLATATPSTTVTTTTATLLSSEFTTKPLPLSTTQQIIDDIHSITEQDTTVYEETDYVTEAFDDSFTLDYGPVPGVADIQDTPRLLQEFEDPIELLLRKLTNSSETPTLIDPADDSETAKSSPASESSTPANVSLTTSTTVITTSTLSTSTTTESADVNQENFEFGHPGEAILVHDISELTTPLPVKKPAVKIDEQIEVGAGVNVKGNLEDAVRFGSILIFDNRVRTDRQQKGANETEAGEETLPDEESTGVTDIPEETTMLTGEDETSDDKIIDEALTEGELSTDYDAGTEEVTTLAVFQDTTVKSLSELLSSAMEAIAESHLNAPSPPLEELEYTADADYTDIETEFPTYDITVGTSVLANSHGPPQSSGNGEVIPVELEPEHKAPETETAPEVEERPSLLGTILDLLTRTESPKPEELPSPPPRPPPFLSPFRPRPRPDARPHNRPAFVPPRFRFTPPPPPPSAPVAIERDTTEDTDTKFLITSPPAPLTTKAPSLPIFDLPPEPPAEVINRPAPGTSRPKPVVNSPIISLSKPDLPNRPDFLPKRPTIVNRPVAPSLSDITQGMPSKPVIEGGFQGMRDEEGIQPNFDYDYDTDGEPTLPPSLPNLKIIPFVAADALVNQEIGIGGDEFKAPPLLLTDIGEENPDNQRPDDTTEAPTTTSRRPFHGRKPILPPRRPLVRPGDESTTTPFQPFRRPGDRPTRPPFTSKTTAPATLDEEVSEDEEHMAEGRPNIPFANREHPSTRRPFIPPRRPTITTDETSSTTTTPRPTTTTTTTRSPPPVATTSTTTLRPIVSDDIANLLLQDVFGLSKPQNAQPVRFTLNRTTPKSSIPFKLSNALPEIPSAVKDQLPLATDPVLASGLLKLSGCNIYGRMYDVGDQIKELSASCKECRCTPLGVQCLPIC